MLIRNKRFVLDTPGFNSFIDPSYSLWVDPSVAMLDTVVESTGSYETCSLTSFWCHEIGTIFAKTMRVIIEIAHISAVITLIGVIAVSTSECMRSRYQRCVGNWKWFRLIDPLITKQIYSLCTNSNARIKPGFVYESSFLTTSSGYMSIAGLTKARIAVVEIAAFPYSAIVIVGTLGSKITLYSIGKATYKRKFRNFRFTFEASPAINPRKPRNNFIFALKCICYAHNASL